MTSGQPPRAVLGTRLVMAMATVYLVWGSTYLAVAVAVAVESIPPFLMMGARSVAGGVVLLLVERARGRDLPAPRVWRTALVGGVLLFVGCHGTLAYAQRSVPSGVAAVMLATIPFWFVLLGRVMPERTGSRPGPSRLAALLPGLAGVALSAWPTGAAAEPVLDPEMIVLLLVSALSWAGGSLVSRRETGADATALAGMELLCGGAFLLLLAALAGEFSDFSVASVTLGSWLGLGYLTLAGSVLAFVAYLWLLDHASARLATTYTFVNPLIAVILGWSVLGERLASRMLLGMALVIGSVVVVWLHDRPAPRDRD